MSRANVVSWLLMLSAVLSAAPVQAHGGFPEPEQILLRPDRPEQIILATNFGLIFSEDGGENWLFSCERPLSAYAAPYLLGAQPSNRIFAMRLGAGLIYSDDDSCSWQVASSTSPAVLPYAFTVDPSNAMRVYLIGADDLHGAESIYVSDDGGLTFGAPAFTAPGSSALLTILVAPSKPSTLFATMFSIPEKHPILLRSDDSGDHWEVAADLVDSLGENPFELLAIDPIDEDVLYARILGVAAETLAKSDDGGLSFVPSVSIPGKLNAFVRLASGTILVGGTAGAGAIGYRSTDGAQSFEPWPEAPHVRALAERNGKLYVAADNFADGYVIAESEDEGAQLRPLTSFAQVRSVKECVADLCAERCAYYAGMDLWPDAICGVASASEADDAGSGGAEPDAAGPEAEANANDAGSDHVSAGSEAGTDADEPRRVRKARSSYRHSGGCACEVVISRPDHRTALLLLGAMLLGARRVRRGR